MKTFLSWLVWLSASTTLWAGGAVVTTDVPVPTQWSRPQVGANGQITPSVPTHFQTRSVGDSLQSGAIVGQPTLPPTSKIITNFGFSIIVAADAGDIETVKLLLSKGANVNTVNTKGASALMAASSHGFLDVMKLLLDKGADINAATLTGWTALIYATQEKQVEAVKLLMKRGADVNVMDEAGKTALDHALALRRDDLVVLLRGQTAAK